MVDVRARVRPLIVREGEKRYRAVCNPCEWSSSSLGRNAVRVAARVHVERRHDEEGGAE